MKKQVITLTLVVSASLFGCSKGADVDTFVAEYKSFTDEVAKPLGAGDYNTARAIFDAKKDAMKVKCTAVKSAIQNNISDQRKWTLAVMDGSMTVTRNIQAGNRGNDIAKMTKITVDLIDVCQ